MTELVAGIMVRVARDNALKDLKESIGWWRVMLKMLAAIVMSRFKLQSDYT